MSNQKAAAGFPTTSDARLEWVDAAKGLAIMVVVFGHALTGVRDAGLSVDGGLINRTIYFIYTFHMAAFFFLSGLFIAPRTNKAGLRVLAKIPANLLWPYVVWGCLLLAVQVVTASYVNQPVGDASPELFLAIWRFPPGPFWYIYVLIFYQIVAVTFLKMKAGPWLLPLGAVLFPLADALRLSADAAIYVGLHFFLFFAMGVVAGTRPEVLTRHSRFESIPLALLLFALMIPVALGAGNAGWTYYDFRLLPVALIGSVALFMISRSPRVSSSRWLSYVGKRTLPIYVMHVFFTAGLRILLAKIFGVDQPSIIVPMAFLAGLIFPLIAYEMAALVGISSFLGLGAPINRRRAPTVGRATV